MATSARSVVLFAITALSLATAAAQQQPPRPADPSQPLTFKVEVNYVEIDATVTDAQGNTVPDLTRDDFDVFEEGRRQVLSVFTRVDLPVERADPPLFRAATVEPDVRTNRRDFDGRVFVIVLDDLHTSMMRTGRLRAAATQFIQRYLGANDIAAIIHTGGTRSGAQEFTGNRAALLRAVNQFVGHRLPSDTLERARDPAFAALTNMPGAADRLNPNEADRAYRARRLLGTLKNVADYLSGVRGRRKAVVLFSEGIDYDVNNAIANRFATDVMQDLQSAIGAAGRANVSFYTVDPRGLIGMEDAIDAQSGVTDPSSLTAIMDESRRAQDSLRTLAEQTGGVAAVNRNNYAETFEKIIRDNSSYYVLGYYSDNAKRDGRYRSVDVKVRRSGLTVRARKGYIAPRGNPATMKGATVEQASPEIREALNSPIPVSGLGLTASAVPFRGAGKNASILVVAEVDGAKFRFQEKDGKTWDEIEFVAVPLEADGDVRDGARDTVGITPRPQTRDTILKSGVRITRRLELPPGRYQMRLAAREAGTGATGSVLLDVNVPDFDKGPLAMSGLAITSDTANGIPTARPDEPLKDVLPGAPTVVREFPRADRLSLFAEIYDSIRPAHRVEITTTLTADDGKVVYTQTDRRDSSELRTRGDGFGHVRTIPLIDIAPGRYVLRVEARPSVSDSLPVFREMELVVR